MRVCPNCQATVSDTANFCDNCGRPFRSSPVAPRAAAPQGAPTSASGSAGVGHSSEAGLCSACGYRNVPGEMFCQNCGVQLAPVASAPPPPPRPLSGPPDANGLLAANGPSVANGLPAASSSSAASAGICPECGSSVSPQDAFCPNCGVQLLQPGARPASGPPASGISAGGQKTPPPASPPVRGSPLPHPVPSPAAQPELTLLVKESGARLSAPRLAELIVGRSDPVRGIFPDVDVTPAGGDTHGVSRRHARLSYRDGQYFIEDLNSTNFTFLNRQRLQPGQPYALKDGDEIRVGLLALQVTIH